MIKVMFVDDEVLAMEYLQNLINWEEEGYHVVGHARSGNAALEMYEREKPQIVISDIKMVGMDGLELTARLKEKNKDIVMILLSAYRDFEYAKKGIEYGVSNYLLKHELSEESLLAELNKVRDQLDIDHKRNKIYQKYFTKQLIYNTEDGEDFPELGNRFFLMLAHKNDIFDSGTFHERAWNSEEYNALDELLETTPEGLTYISDVQLTENNLLILYRIENISSKYLVGSLIERMSRKVGSALSVIEGCRFNILFSGEIFRNEISTAFRKMSRLVRYSLFLKPQGVYEIGRLSVSEEEEKIVWNGPEKELRTQIYEEMNVEDYIGYLFELVKYPAYNLKAAMELIYMLENLARELEGVEGVTPVSHEDLFKLDEIKQYYSERLQNIQKEMQEEKRQKYSKQVLEIIRYIRKNYQKEISLESLGEEFKMNGVYLGQIFKKETGTTFLKYLTELRVSEAKRLLDEGELSISQIAEQTGYKSSQYFSQIFIKTTGMKPQEYRKWKKTQ